MATLEEWVELLRADEIDFLELGSEEVVIEGKVFQRFAARGSAWAASLAVAMRPHLFSLGAAPLALAGLAPRRLFRAEPESPLPALLTEAIGAAAVDVATDLAAMRSALALGDERLAALYASSQAPAVWQLISGLGPLTRAELARALGVTRRTASQAATALDKADLAMLRPGDHALAPKMPSRASLGALRGQRDLAVGDTDPLGRRRPPAQQLTGKTRRFVFASKRDRSPVPFRPDPPPGELDDRGPEQIAAQRDGVAAGDVPFRANRFEPDEAPVGQAIHARMNAAGGLMRSNGNFESVESD